MTKRLDGHNGAYLAPWLREMVQASGKKPPFPLDLPRSSATVGAPETDTDIETDTRA